MYILILSCLATISMCSSATTDTGNSSVINAEIVDLLDDRERIIGGEPANDGDLKYQLSLSFHRFHHCGASLIEVDGIQLAVTAAHCTEQFDPQQLLLVAGDIRLSDRSGKEQVRQVTKIVNHEDYDPETISYDISLVFFHDKFVLNEWVGPIPLPEQDQDTKGTGLVSGWGVYSYHGVYSDNLTKVEVPIVDDELCKNAYAPLEYEYFDHFLCAGFLGVGAFKDSCKGDSGGPLKSVDHGYLAGIVSWSEGCAHPRFPGVHTEVSYFVDWIHDEVAKHKDIDKKRDRERVQPLSDYIIRSAPKKKIVRPKPKRKSAQS